MDFKYLADGRKVVVVGQLNNVESIVQEVFVTDSGDEIPSGEKFTTKNLHDAPVVSWKAKKEAELEASLNAVKGKLAQLHREECEVKERLKGLRAIFGSARALAETLDEQDFETLALFMSGACEYIVIEGYGAPELAKFDETLINMYERRFDGIKLVSLFGKTNGDISYRLHRYSDGSGGSQTVYPCRDLEQARALLLSMTLESIERGRFPSVAQVEKLRKAGVVLDKKTAKKIREHAASANKKSIEHHEASCQKIRDKIDADNKALEAALASA